VKLFFRTPLPSTTVLNAAESFFPRLALAQTAKTARERTFAGPLGTVSVTVTSEGGHATFVEASTDQIGESRLDKNVKLFFVGLHRAADPTHALEAGY
jgi:hypothetical protein